MQRQCTASSGVTVRKLLIPQERQFSVLACPYTYFILHISPALTLFSFVCVCSSLGPHWPPFSRNNQMTATPRYWVYGATWNREQPTVFNKTVPRKRWRKAKGKAGFFAGLTQQEKQRQHCRTRQRSFLPLFPSARSSPHQPFISGEEWEGAGGYCWTQRADCVKSGSCDGVCDHTALEGSEACR